MWDVESSLCRLSTPCRSMWHCRLATHPTNRQGVGESSGSGYPTRHLTHRVAPTCRIPSRVTLQRCRAAYSVRHRAPFCAPCARGTYTTSRLSACQVRQGEITRFSRTALLQCAPFRVAKPHNVTWGATCGTTAFRATHIESACSTGIHPIPTSDQSAAIRRAV